MEKSKLEKYLKIYPEIDVEIARLENELLKLKSQKIQFIDSNYSGKQKNDMLKTIETALALCENEYSDAISARSLISIGLNSMDSTQKKLIEVRFWNGKNSPTIWRDVAESLAFHRTHAERIYKCIIENMLFLKTCY